MSDREAPWKDFNGRAIHEGDIIRHPSGEQGRVIFNPAFARPEDQWRVDYGETAVSRLCLQVGFKGQAELVSTCDA